MSVFLKVPQTTLKNTIEYSKNCLSKVLKKRWDYRLFPHNPDPNCFFPHVSLLVDSTTIPINRPGSFENAKEFFDGKNWVYGIKKEVAVMVNPPYFALFSQKGFPGAIHDFTFFKENYKTYLPYLKKNPQDFISFPRDNSSSWSVICDKGYIGKETYIPGLRRITPKKKPLSAFDKLNNKRIKESRVRIEMFFGRLKQSWHIIKNKYRLTHKNLEMDFDLCVYLTNELIKRRELTSEDRTFYKQLKKFQKSQFQEKRRKQKEATERYKKKKTSLYSPSQIVSQSSELFLEPDYLF